MKNRTLLDFLACFSLVGLLGPGCQSTAGISVTIANKLSQDRPVETVAIPLSAIQVEANRYGAENLQVTDVETGAVLLCQLIDNDGDGKPDELLFQTDMKANSEKQFRLKGAKDGAARQPKNTFTTYSRFVPERIDDYAWENELVAFRTYGPEAQRLTEAGNPGGTLSSGMDCWLKRVSYPVIDKWYKNNVREAGYYHKDHGEGYDPYHVGSSRGCGGIGVRINDSLYVSKNFVSYKTLANGPIRTLFELRYAPWDAGGTNVSETKRISLDLGSQLTRYDVTLSADLPLTAAVIGLTLHEAKGEVKADTSAGWYRYWEPVDDSRIGTGIVLDPAFVTGYQDCRTTVPDQSQLLIFARPKDKKIAYYAGFGWSKAGLITTAEAWDAYLAGFAKRLASPLEIRVR